ncbi:ZPR1_zinc-finger domain-containing protein [Hexamita inflata]|uniref:ZPR1 zinc-finger domain-containing protein n=1 Tax=Hexamita inflata TaxID=28002 RepID=A0AA86NUY0_9EUKA|nr:ZPR1 zinc-finger domain-containing protein [Hexamita inflata]
MSDNEESSSSSCNIEDIAGEMNLDIGKQMTMASYCTNCGKQAVTRMLFITVPKFREMMVSSIKCRHCGFFGRDIQQVAEIQNFGSIATLEAKCARDLSRGVVKSSTCTVKIPTIGFEIQARPMSGVYTTVEGLLRSAADTVVSEPTLILTNVYVIIALENQITVFMLIITYSINSAVHFFFTSSFK